MSDLADFLLARIAEDEEQLATARRMGVPPLPGGSRVFSGIGNHPTVSETRLAAECDAKRRIVEQFLATREAAEHIRETFDGATDVRAKVERTSADAAAHAWHHALCLLALPCADHPDYDESWRP